jgi:hypothetical protein
MGEKYLPLGVGVKQATLPGNYHSISWICVLAISAGAGKNDHVIIVLGTLSEALKFCHSAKEEDTFIMVI